MFSISGVEISALSLFRSTITSVALIGLVTSGAYAQSGNPSSTILDDVRLPDAVGSENVIDQISGLSWDQDEQLLYAVSDYGHLITFKVEIANGKITKVEPVSYSPVAYKNGAQTFSDAEGIVVLNSANGVKGDSQIAIAFEDGPAAAKFDPQGNFLEAITLPAELADLAVYRASNQSIESIGYSADLGFLFTPQEPLVGESSKIHKIYSSQNKTWEFNAILPANTYSKDLQVQSDSSVMVLEGVKLGGILSWFDMGSREVRLRKIDLRSCKPGLACTVVDYVSKDPTAMQDRFEGMTSIGQNMFLLATDERSGSRLILVQVNP